MEHPFLVIADDVAAAFDDIAPAMGVTTLGPSDQGPSAVAVVAPLADLSTDVQSSRHMTRAAMNDSRSMSSVMALIRVRRG